MSDGDRAVRRLKESAALCDKKRTTDALMLGVFAAMVSDADWDRAIKATREALRSIGLHS